MSVRLEIKRNACVDVTSEGVIHLRESVAVTETSWAGLLTGKRRRLVEDVVRTKTEVVVVANFEGERQVEVVLSIEPSDARRRRCAQVVQIDSAEVPPANRSAYTVGEIEPNAGLMAPFRGRRTADVAVQTNAFGVFETGHARIEPVRIQPGARRPALPI